jgi:hypothetical protein
MKKLLLTLALCASFASAFAGTGASSFIRYDYDHVNHAGATPGLEYRHEVIVGGAVDTGFGIVDAGVIGRQLNTDSSRDNNLGYEFGYTVARKFQGAKVSARAGYGAINKVDLRSGAFSGNSKYWSLGGEVSAPLSQNLSAFVGYRHRNGLNALTPVADNRVTAGVDLALTQGASVRLGYAYGTGTGLVKTNGITTALNFEF